MCIALSTTPSPNVGPTDDQAELSLTPPRLLFDKDLRTQLLDILANENVLPDENEKPILGPELLLKVKQFISPGFSDGSIKTYFSQFAKNESSPIARTVHGFGYFRRTQCPVSNVTATNCNSAFTDDIDDTDCGRRDYQSEEKFRALYIQYLKREKKFPIAIVHTRSQKLAKGVNLWKFPDVVTLTWNIAIQSETEDKLLLDNNLFEIKKAIGDPPFVLISSELKVNVTLANFRQCFFQCVSNSKWAHEAHLVIACRIEDSKLVESLQKLGAAFKVSIFSFNMDPSDIAAIQSAWSIRSMKQEERDSLIDQFCSDINIIYLAQSRSGLDWDHIQDVREVNTDYNYVFKWLSKCLKDGQAYTMKSFIEKEREEMTLQNLYG